MRDENMRETRDKIFISYLDDDDKEVSGNFIKISETNEYIKFKTNSGSIITLPWNRIKKVKENCKEVNKQ